MDAKLPVIDRRDVMPYLRVFRIPSGPLVFIESLTISPTYLGLTGGFTVKLADSLIKNWIKESHTNAVVLPKGIGPGPQENKSAKFYLPSYKVVLNLQSTPIDSKNYCSKLQVILLQDFICLRFDYLTTQIKNEIDWKTMAEDFSRDRV